MTGQWNQLKRRSRLMANGLALLAISSGLPGAYAQTSAPTVTPVVLSQGVEPKLLDRVAPAYPNVNRQGVEGWVKVLFDVDATGKVVDPVVIDSSADRHYDTAFRESVLKAVQEWQYEPARVDGEPVRRANMTVFTAFLFNDSAGGTTRKFHTGYTRVADALDNDDLEKARKELDRLASRPRHVLAESAYLDMLEAMWHQKAGQDLEALRFVEQGLVIADDAAVTRAYDQLLRMSVTQNALNHNFHTALERYETLSELDGGLAADDPVHGVAQRIHEILADEAPIMTEGKLTPCTTCREPEMMLTRNLNRRQFTIEPTQGQVDDIRITCGPAHTTVAWAENIAWQINQDPADCKVVIKGDDKTTLQLIEIKAQEDTSA